MKPQRDDGCPSGLRRLTLILNNLRSSCRLGRRTSRDFRLAASRIRALLTRRDRGEPRLDALQVREDGVAMRSARPYSASKVRMCSSRCARAA